MIDKDAIRQRWEAVGSKLDERGQRLFAAVEVRTAGWGGLAIVSKITGLARSTINRAARLIWTRNRCRRGKSAAPVAGVAQYARRIQGWCRLVQALRHSKALAKHRGPPPRTGGGPVCPRLAPVKSYLRPFPNTQLIRIKNCGFHRVLSRARDCTPLKPSSH
jgi:hypothetical protein